jgi:MFS transporter, DHA3 family, macrolide efflux protein
MVLPAIFSRRVSGAPAFLLIASTQLLSIMVSQISGFAMAVWAYSTTGQVLPGASIVAIQYLPPILLGPVVGVWIDRYDRKRLLMLGDSLSAIGAVVLFVMAINGQLQIWHLYIEAVLVGIGQTIQQPAYAAIIGSLVSKSNLNRANSIAALIDYLPWTIAPFIGGLIYGVIGITGILTLDLITFGIALAAFAVVHVPGMAGVVDPTKVHGAFWQEARAGVAYIMQRPSFRNMLLISLLIDICLGAAYAVREPMILARTANNTVILGTVQMMGGIGGLLASVVLTVCSNIQRQMRLSTILVCVWGVMLMCLAMSRTGWMWALALLSANMTGQLALTLQRSIWQSKVPPALQGRVFSMRRMLTTITSPLTPIIASLFADHWFEPMMRTAGAEHHAIAALLGSGPGAGIAIILLVAGAGVLLAGLITGSVHSVRQVEQILPDHSSVPVA